MVAALAAGLTLATFGHASALPAGAGQLPTSPNVLLQLAAGRCHVVYGTTETGAHVKHIICGGREVMNKGQPSPLMSGTWLPYWLPGGQPYWDPNVSGIVPDTNTYWTNDGRPYWHPYAW
jgi:hypothetical protein